MATQRYISTSFWDDRWVRSLDHEARYVFLYLMTNSMTNIAGVYKITIDRIAFDTGVPEDRLRAVLQRFADDRKAVFYHDEWMILPRWPKHQQWEKRARIAEGIDKVLEELPRDVLETMQDYGYAYPMNKVLIGYQYGPSYSDTDKDTDKDTDSELLVRVDAIIDYLNAKVSKNYRHTDANRKHIKARLNDGYTEEECLRVIDIKTGEWEGTDFERHLNCETLFRPGKFDKYLNQDKPPESELRLGGPDWKKGA